MKLIKRVVFLGLCIYLIGGASITWVSATQKSTESLSEDRFDNELAGMSAMMNSYYEEVLSEDGISVDNVSTTLNIDGQKLPKVDRIPAFFSTLAFAKVNDYVNIRSEASVESEPCGRLYANAAATILSKKNGWVKISSNDITGYVKEEYLAMGQDAITIANRHYTRYATVTAEELPVYIDFKDTKKVVKTIKKNAEFKVEKVEENWVKLSSDSVNGWVSKDYINFTYHFTYATSMEEAKKLDEKKQRDPEHMIWPLPADHRICSYYGPRKAPCPGASTFHKGLDIGGATGLKVVSVLAGTVTASTYSSSGGYYVEIDHGNGFKTRYLHNSKLLVKKGQRVNQGDVISLVGSTGISTGSHLHFSVIKNGVNVDPYPYLKKVH